MTIFSDDFIFFAGGVNTEVVWGIPNSKEIAGIIDIGHKTLMCNRINFNPYESKFLAIGGLISNFGPVVCGGQDNTWGKPTNNCSILYSQESSASMSRGRVMAASVTFYDIDDESKTVLLITGGVASYPV